METNIHVKGFALHLVLKQRRRASRKWPIYTFQICFCSYVSFEGSNDGGMISGASQNTSEVKVYMSSECNKCINDVLPKKLQLVN